MAKIVFKSVRVQLSGVELQTILFALNNLSMSMVRERAPEIESLEKKLKFKRLTNPYIKRTKS